VLRDILVRIRNSDIRIRIQLRILLFSSATFKTTTKIFFFLITFCSYTYIIFQRQKAIKKSQNSRNQGFSYYFCLMIDGSRSGSVSSTNGSGSATPSLTIINESLYDRGEERKRSYSEGPTSPASEREAAGVLPILHMSVRRSKKKVSCCWQSETGSKLCPRKKKKFHVLKSWIFSPDGLEHKANVQIGE
jgi:hypothetical protein